MTTFPSFPVHPSGHVSPMAGNPPGLPTRNLAGGWPGAISERLRAAVWPCEIERIVNVNAKGKRGPADWQPLWFPVFKEWANGATIPEICARRNISRYQVQESIERFVKERSFIDVGA